MDLKSEELSELIGIFAKLGSYRAKDSNPKVQHVMQRCIDLFSLDYNFSILSNTNGELSTNYPSQLLILEDEKQTTPSQSTILCNGGGSGKTGDSNSNGGGCSTSTSTIQNGLSSSTSSSSTFNHNKENVAAEFHVGGNGNGNKETNNFVEMRLSSFSGFNSTTNIDNQSEIYIESAKLKDLCTKARFARCRARFPVPVILFNKKYICRSATLSGGPEIYGRSSFDYFFSGGTDKVDEDDIDLPETPSDWQRQLFDRVRSQDIRLLKSFQVHSIIDLMVEKKKVKFGVNVTSSEKVDKENRYADFNIISLPYPGCEFFKKYRDNGYNAEDLLFEWTQSHVDANIFVPISNINQSSLNINWSHYTNWDLVKLTQNYLKLILQDVIKENDKGLLVHCISGWDRTPLFISLIRLSLWADGRIHKSLNAEQILYLTIAYDWMLFGHNLNDRLVKGEEIFFFCFYFLKHIIDAEYSVDYTGDFMKTITPTKAPNNNNFSCVRNDSENNLVESVLLDDSIINSSSPKGSNWSLSSCSSCQSHQSHESQPPTYFQVTQGSWEECIGSSSSNGNGALNPVNGQSPIAAHQSKHTFAQNHTHYQNQNPSINQITNSTSSHVNKTLTNSKKDMDLVNNSQENAQSSSLTSSNHNHNHHQKNSLSSSNQNHINLQRSSPVPIKFCERPEPDSSVSTIGSWQLITGTGSLKEYENISNSDPSGLAFRKHAGSRSRLNDNTTSTAEHANVVNNITLKTLPSLKNELKVDNLDFTTSGVCEHPLGEFNYKNLEEMEENGSSVTPSTSHYESYNGASLRSSMLCRSERLQTVRSTFYSIYASTIGFQCRNISENGSSSGLGFLIGNFANKVGIGRGNRSNV